MQELIEVNGKKVEVEIITNESDVMYDYEVIDENDNVKKLEDNIVLNTKIETTTLNRFKKFLCCC